MTNLKTLKLESRDRMILIGLALVTLVTRPHLIEILKHVPDTALATFFVLGFLVRSPLAFAALFLLGFAIDVVAIGMMGVSDFCFTAAYWMLLPAYATMWLAGRFADARIGDRLSALPLLALLVAAASLVSHLFASGGFYFLGGRFPDASLAGFLPRFERYFPMTLLSAMLWSGVAAALYALVVTVRPALRRVRAR